MSPDVVVWLRRLIDILPALIDLWELVDTRDEQAAQFALVRAIKDRQAREAIHG